MSEEMREHMIYFRGIQGVREGFSEVIMHKMKQRLHRSEQISCGESYIRMSSKPPANFKFYVSIINTLILLYCGECFRRMLLARK